MASMLLLDNGFQAVREALRRWMTEKSAGKPRPTNHARRLSNQ